jgi:proteasome lid subunit RPN8/RPN11
MRWTDLTDAVTLPSASEDLVKDLTERIGSTWSSDSGQALPVISQSALEEIRQHLYADLKQERMGLLLGSAVLSRELDRILVCIDRSVPDLHASSSRERVAMQRESWPSVWKSMAQYPHTQIVGWYHSHPNYGVFLSAEDRQTQFQWFQRDWHVALVMDPIRGDYGAFTGRTGTPTPIVVL